MRNSSDIERIRITYEMNFDCSDRYDIRDFCKLFVDFTIDCESRKLIPNFNMYPDRDCEKYNLSLKNVLRKELDLDRDRLDEFLEEFSKLKLNDSDGKYFRPNTKTLEKFISVYFSDDVDFCFDVDSNYWLCLGEMLLQLVGFDILNIETSKYLISDLHYDLKRDGVYDKQTSRKLKLKSLTFQHGEDLSSTKPTIRVDFENMMIDGNDDASGDKLDVILDLLEKYHVYELDDKRYWQKSIDCPCDVGEGNGWYLQLTFEDGKNWVIGHRNNYPDVFVHLAQEVIDLTGDDILKLFEIAESELELYKKYGDQILGI